MIPFFLLFFLTGILLRRIFWVSIGTWRSKARSFSTLPSTRQRTRPPCGTTGRGSAPSGPSISHPSLATSRRRILRQLRWTFLSNWDRLTLDYFLKDTLNHWETSGRGAKVFRKVRFPKISFPCSKYFYGHLIRAVVWIRKVEIFLSITNYFTSEIWALIGISGMWIVFRQTFRWR